MRLGHSVVKLKNKTVVNVRNEEVKSTVSRSFAINTVIQNTCVPKVFAYAKRETSCSSSGSRLVERSIPGSYVVHTLVASIEPTPSIKIKFVRRS